MYVARRVDLTPHSKRATVLVYLDPKDIRSEWPINTHTSHPTRPTQCVHCVPRSVDLCVRVEWGGWVGGSVLCVVMPCHAAPCCAVLIVHAALHLILAMHFLCAAPHRGVHPHSQLQGIHRPRGTQERQVRPQAVSSNALFACVVWRLACTT